jgi:hypothetical protein
MATCRAIALALSVAFGAAVIGAAPADAAAAFTVSGTRSTHAPPYPEQLVPALFADDVVTQIDYPAALIGMDRSIAVAVTGIVNDVETTPAPVVVAGFSQGAVAVAAAKQALMALPAEQRPTAGQLSFITVGDPSGPGGILRLLPFRVPLIGLTPITAPDTPYDTVTVNGEYDGWADFPDRPGNLLSVANALMGIVYVHGRYETVPGGLDLSTVPARNITTTTNSLGGHTTEYLIPTPQLPMLAPLRQIGVPEPIVAALEKPLKAKVDAGYSRNDVAGSAGAVRSPVAAAVSADAGSGGHSAPRASVKARPGQRHSRAAA